MIKNIINSPLSHNIQRAIAPYLPSLNMRYGLYSFPPIEVMSYYDHLKISHNQAALLMKLYDIHPGEPIVDPAEQPGYYNVYDDDEFPETNPESNSIPAEERVKDPGVTNKVPLKDDPQGPNGEGVI